MMNGIFKGDNAMDGIGGSFGKRPYKYFYSFLGLIVLLSVIPIYNSPSAAGQELEKVYIEFDFDPAVQSIQVGPGDPCMVQFKGKARITTFIPQGRQVLVNLSYEIFNDDPTLPSIWVAAISEPTIIFDPTVQENDVTVTVRCPPFEIKNVMYRIKLGGQWQINPGTSGYIDEPFTLTVVTAQYSMVRINSPHSFVTGYPGEQRQYTLQVKNDGNGEDWFEVKFMNQDSLVETGFALVYETKKTEKVQPGETVNFTFDIIGPRSTVLWRSRISEVSIEVSSLSAEKVGTHEKLSYSVFYQEKGTYYDVTFCVAFLSIISIMLFLPFYFYKYIVRKRRFRQEVIRSLEEEGLL